MLASTVRNTQALIIHLSASFYPLLEEIAETREADRDATVNEKQLVAVEGSSQPASGLRPALWHPDVGSQGQNIMLRQVWHISVAPR